MAPPNLNQIVAAFRAQQSKVAGHEAMLNQIMGLLKAQSDVPKWIEDIPGRRSPFFAPVNLTIQANSTSQVTGTYTVSADGPFVVTGVAAFYKRTEGPYLNEWHPVTTFAARIAPVTQGIGHGYVYDKPVLISGDIEIVDHGSGRNWQDGTIASAVLSPQAGGIYVLPVAHLFDTNSVVSCKFTPGAAEAYAGVVQFVLCGYKIVQGNQYQP